MGRYSELLDDADRFDDSRLAIRRMRPGTLVHTSVGEPFTPDVPGILVAHAMGDAAWVVVGSSVLLLDHWAVKKRAARGR